MTVFHRPLRDRENVLSSDVADAFEMLIGNNDTQGADVPDFLPKAFDKMDVVRQLVEIASMNDEGEIERLRPAIRKAVEEKFYNRLTNSAVFQAGYKKYEERAKLPVVPVTDFFFKVVYAGGDTADCLECMTVFEVQQSLPKRRGRVRTSVDEQGNVMYMRGENGEALTFGELAGVIVFPANAQCDLLREWIKRQVNNTTGKIDSTVVRIENARPDAVAVERLQEAVSGLRPTMTRALPRPTPRR